MTKLTNTSLIAVCGFLAAASTGCMQDPLCTELGDCGGATPVGTWLLQPGSPSCMEDLYLPPADTRLLGAEVPSARQPVIEPAFFDWCYLLVTGPGDNIQVKPPRFFYESGQIGRVTLTYEAPASSGGYGHYSVGISRTGSFSLTIPALCMREFGAMDGKPAIGDDGKPAGPGVDVCKQLEPPLKASGVGEGSYPNTVCNGDGLGGCVCSFDVTETGGGSGSYKQLDKNTIIHLPGTNFPQKATFCNKGSSLELTGKDGNYLFGQKGLRTMKMAKGLGAAPMTPAPMTPAPTTPAETTPAM